MINSLRWGLGCLLLGMVTGCWDPLDLAIENFGLRQQLGLFAFRRPKVMPRMRDRWIWAILSRAWSGWKRALIIVQPETVLRWQRAGWRLFWRWKSRRGGRPGTDLAIARLVREMAGANPTWGAPRIHGELRMLGFDIAERTVARLMPRKEHRPTGNWAAFLKTQANGIASVDLFVIPTVSFRLLYGIVIVHHLRRKIVHVNVTYHPHAVWVAQQVIEAFPFDEAPRFLLRDRDSVYGSEFRTRIRNMGIEEILTAFRSPWQNGVVERTIGSIRRDVLDRVIVWGEEHARGLLLEYARYHGADRTHLTLAKDTPDGREVEGPEKGARIVGRPVVDGLHHRYYRKAA